jgi:hypothetical protein
MPWDKVRKIQSQADGNVGHFVSWKGRGKGSERRKKENRRRAD